jgi:RNA polymerase primary sigma factor
MKQEEVNAVKNEIAVRNQRFVVAVAKKFSNNTNIMDTIEEGNIGLMEAIDSYDLSKGAKFSTWAVFFIRRSINRYFIETEPMVRQTNRVLTYHVKASATNKFQQMHHRLPSQEELMDFINENYAYNIKDQSDLMDIITTSMDYISDDGIENMGEVKVYEASLSSETDKKIETDHTITLVKRLLHILTQNERIVVEQYYGINSDRNYELVEISEKMGYTTERIRQLKNSALNKMKSFIAKK